MKNKVGFIGLSVLFGAFLLAGCNGSMVKAVDSANVLISTDTNPPEIKSIKVSPSSVDTTDSDQLVTVTMRITDDAGFEFNSSYGWYAPILNGTGSNMFTGTMVRTSGDAKDGIYVQTVVIPKQSAAGTMKINRIDLGDILGNKKTYSYDELRTSGFVGLDVANTTVDKLPPNIHNGIKISPAKINVADKDQEIIVSMAVQDIGGNGSGGRNQLRISNGKKIIDITDFVIVPPFWGPTYGYYSAKAVIPRGTPLGKWSVVYLKIFDAAGNERDYSYYDLASVGYSSGLDIIVE